VCIEVSHVIFYVLCYRFLSIIFIGQVHKYVIGILFYLGGLIMKAFPIFRLIVVLLSLLLITMLIINEQSQTTDVNATKALSAEEQDLLGIFNTNVKLAQQIANELDFLVKEYEKTDELEGAIDAMGIAKEESEKLLSDVQQTTLEPSSDLFNLKWKFENVLIDYIAGLSMQLDGFENADGKLASDGYIIVSTSREELKKLFIELEKF